MQNKIFFTGKQLLPGDFLFYCNRNWDWFIIWISVYNIYLQPKNRKIYSFPIDKNIRLCKITSLSPKKWKSSTNVEKSEKNEN